MPLIFFILLVVLIAQVGFWNTLGAVLGAAAMMALFVILIIVLVAMLGLYVAKRLLS
jgi:hypothetical protein